MAHRQTDDGVAGCGELLHDGEHRGSGSPDHRLVGAVEVGHDASVDTGNGSFDLVQRRQHRRHQPPILDVDLAHLTAARAHRLERVLEGERPCRHQRSVLAKAVAHDDVGHDPVGREKPGQGQVGGHDRRLSDLGLAQRLVGSRDGGRILRVHKDVLAERPAEQGGHDPVGVGKGLGDDRLDLAQRRQHVHVLGSLAGVQEGDLGRLTATAVDAAGAQRLPHRAGGRLLLEGERPGREADLLGQLRSIPVVDGDAFGRAQVALEGWRRRRRGASTRGLTGDG